MAARQKLTKPDTLGELSTAQIIAMGALLDGATDGEAAELAGVSRQTVNTWRHNDAQFMAGLAAARLEIWEGAADRTRGLAQRALDVLAADLDGDDPKLRQTAALAVLRAVGLTDLRPTGPTDAEGIELVRQREERERALERIFAE